MKLEHSQGAATYEKVAQIRSIFEHALDVHKKNHPDKPFGLTELYGSPVSYPESDDTPAFKGSPVQFCEAAKARGIRFKLIIFEVEKERADTLEAELTPYKAYGDIHIFHNSNEYAAMNIMQLKTASGPLPEYGILTADPDGVLPLPLVMNVHALMPEYDLLVNFNCNAEKRQKGRQSTEEKESAKNMLLFIELFPTWHKAMSKLRDVHQWALTYVSKNKIDRKALDMTAFHEEDGLQYLTRIAVTEVQRKLGVNIFSPKIGSEALFKSIGIKIERLFE